MPEPHSAGAGDASPVSRYDNTRPGVPGIVSAAPLVHSKAMQGLLLVRLAAIVALILGNGFFVAAEFAIVSLRRSRVTQMLAAGEPGARSAERLQSRLDDFLPAVQFGVTLCSLALGWIGEPTVAGLLDPLLGGLPHAAVFAHIVSAAVAFLVITYFHVLLGELVPKSLALRRGEQMAAAVAGPMLAIIRITRPAVRLLNRSAALVLRIFRTPPAHHASLHSPEELKLIATAAREGGMLPRFQEELIHRAVEGSHVPTREIMTPRQRIVALPASMPIEQASGRIVEEMHSRIPIYDPVRGPEAIVGVVYAKDVARLMHFRALGVSGGQAPPLARLEVGALMREMPVVPETKSAFDLLVEFQQQRRHMAVVVDEFGSTVGLVTVEDAIEQLVGELDDEYDEGSPAASLLPSLAEALTLEGATPLRDLDTQVGWKLPRDSGAETLAGFVLSRLGHLPRPGEGVDFGRHRLTVLEMQGRRISKVRVEDRGIAAPDLRKPGVQNGSGGKG